MSVPSWPVLKARYAFRRRDVRGAAAPLASATKDGVFLRDDLDISVWNPSSDISNYKLVEPDDFVIGLRSFQHGISHSTVRGLVSPAYTVLRAAPALDPRFIKHFFRSHVLISQLQVITQGIRQGQTIDLDAFSELDIPIPHLDEQRRIADFLDAETARIDDLAYKHFRLVRLLDEKVDSRILSLIGDSELSQPKGAPSVPIRRVLGKINRPTMPANEVITAFRDGQVTARSMRREEGYTLSASQEPQGQGVAVGDVVIHGLDGFAGAVGDAEASGNCSPVYHVCVPNDGGNYAFYGRMLRVLAVNNYLGLFAVSTRERAVDFRSWDLFGNIPIPRIDPGVQHEIGQSIIKARPLREAVARFNSLLAERKLALITAAVTGQIDVTTARGADAS